MKPVKEAKKYAKMFVSTIGIDDIPAALAELSSIERLMAGSGEFKSLLLNPGFSVEERTKVLTEIAGRLKVSEKVLRFLIHLTAIKVIAALPEIISHANAIYLEKKQRARAVVMTPVEISTAHEERLKVSLKKLINRDVDIEYVMDPTLMGGVLVKVGSTMYDSSIKGQLRLLKDELIKG